MHFPSYLNYNDSMAGLNISHYDAHKQVAFDPEINGDYEVFIVKRIS